MPFTERRAPLGSTKVKSINTSLTDGVTAAAVEDKNLGEAFAATDRAKRSIGHTQLEKTKSGGMGFVSSKQGAAKLISPLQTPSDVSYAISY